jgi:hypothetical protein
MPTYLPPRRGISQSAAMAEARAFARVDEPELLTLALYHSAFLDSSSEPTAIYLVCDWQPLTATLEDDAPLDGGEEVTFLPVPMRVVFPEETEDGKDPRAQIEVDNVLRIISPYLRAAAGSMEPIRMMARTYLPSDTSAPHEMPPLSLEVQSANSDGVNVRFTAGYGDVLNFPFPSVRYDREGFPALAAMPTA